jgi:hypothetical protein
MIGLLPKSTGVYSLAFLLPQQLHKGFDEGLHLEEVIQLGQSVTAAERMPVYKSIYYVINDGNVNFSLFQKHCIAVSTSTAPTEPNIYFERKGTFTFRVAD